MAFFRYFVILRGVFSLFRLFAWRFFVISLFRVALFRYFVFSRGVISLFCVALFRGKKAKRRNGTNQPHILLKHVPSAIQPTYITEIELKF